MLTPTVPAWTNSTELSLLVDTAFGNPAESATAPGPVMPVTVTMYVAGPVWATVGVSVPPTVVPAKLTSAASNPATGSPNVTSNTTGDTVVGSGWPAAWLTVTVGASRSTVTS